MEIHKWNRLDCKRTAQRTNKVQELKERTEKLDGDIVKKGGAEGKGVERRRRGGWSTSVP
jgi:mRNA-degrading endonuclease RelE of RelBE toxin-antitoxin system